ncbi:MAG: hypothetical protein J0I12_33465 [Candidatus Eremiobacteraeota bacterium]|nr:hypothetical protein [Candidatus Eremiobacteraeota bacterium]
MPRFARLLRRTQGPYTLVSAAPPILYVQMAEGTLADFLEDFQMLFQALRGQPVHLLCCHGGIEENLLQGSLEIAARCAEAFPDLHFHHLCNEEKSVEEWRRQGLQAIHCNHNAFVDERVFRPLDGQPKRYRAVYDARLVPLKRHELAAEVQDLALIYYVVPVVDDMEYVCKVQQDLAGAHCFNLEAGNYRLLDSTALNHSLNDCGVGLCLSEAEGSMYAAGQYLLSGLGVVTTPSRGGRDCFWDAQSALEVEATPQAVCEGVTEMLSRQLDPWQVHHSTLRRMQIHRQRFFELVESIWRAQGVEKRLADEWPGLFFNRFLRNQNHLETIDRISGAAGRP